MSFSMQKLRSLLPGQHAGAVSAAQRHSVSLEPEIGFQITIELNQQQLSNSADASALSYQKAMSTVPELNVHLIAARHLPTLFGFKVVQGYLIKVKLFPGTKRLDSSVQTNSWPKFNENFKFPLAPDLKPSIKQYSSTSASSRRSSRTVSDFTPEELFAGQFVVFTVYALLELPPASFNRFNKTYRSLRDKSTNLVQKVVESSSGKSKDDKENTNGLKQNEAQKAKRKSSDNNPREGGMPALTISEARRNIGSVTCYLEPKIFKRNTRTGLFATEELWLPIKDINTTVVKGETANLATATKGVVELALEVKDLSESAAHDPTADNGHAGGRGTAPSAASTNGGGGSTGVSQKNPQWNRMTSEVKRKMGISNNSRIHHDLVLRIGIVRMRCSNKVKDELESTAGSVYIKTTVFEHGIYIDSWKSATFYPSLSTKWDAILDVPLQAKSNLDNILIRTTLATKSKMGKKLVLGTVLIGAAVPGSGADHIQQLVTAAVNERVPMWHSYQ